MLIAELADDVERLAWWLLESEAQLVRCDRTLDLCAHVGSRLEEAVSGHEPVERLMRTLEVVVADEVIEPLLRVDDMREHRAAEKLVPQRLPESLDLAERLRMLRPAADVLDPHPRQCLFELGLAPPHRVLAPVVGQHFRGLPVRGDAALERFHHERRLLVVRERVPHDESAVVIHEHAHVQPLCSPQPEREDVRLPELIRCRSLEAPRRVLARGRRLRRLDQTLFVQDPSHDLLRDAQCLEALQHVTNAPRPPVLVFKFERHHALALYRAPRCRLLLRAALRGLQPRSSACSKLL